MGSTAEGADTPKETLAAADTTGLPSSALGSNSALPEGGVEPERDASPADVAATTPPVTPEKEPGAEEEPVERASKRARVDEGKTEMRAILRNLKKITGALEKASGLLDETTSQIKQNNVEVEQLSKQMGLDQASCRWQLATLQTFTNKLESMEWQISGGKRLVAPTLKEQGSNLLKEMKQVSYLLDQNQKQSRAQSDLLISHLKSIERALGNMASSFSQISIVTNAPGGGGTTAPAVAPTGTPTVPAAAMPAGTPTVPTATMPAAAATTAEATPPLMPGYAAIPSAGGGTPITPGAPGVNVAPAPTAPTFPPVPAFPLGTPPASGITQGQPGRLRIRSHDGTILARAVSPTGRRVEQVSREWLDEFGMGTITHQGLLYRVIPDSYLGNSVALN